MKKLLYSVLALGALVGGAILVAEKTSTYTASDQVNPQAPVQTRQRIRIAASPEKVWRVMSRVDQWATWQPDITAPQLNGPFQPGTTFNWQSGGLTIVSTLHTVEPFRHIGWSGPALGSFAVHNWTFQAHEGYTEVLVEESMEGWLVQLLRPKFQTGLDTSIAFWLAQLKKEAEKP